MSRISICLLLMAMTALGTEVPTPSVSTDQTKTLTTFNTDVLPVLQNNCQACHRPGGIAPMSFMTYETTRPFAKAIKAAVVSKKMPPWFADPHVGEFRNAPSLTQADITKLAAWADSGAPEGDAAQKPADREFTDGWRIRPDVVVSMPTPYWVAAKGPGEVRQFTVPNPFTEDTWVSAIEIRPGDPSVVHHVIVQIPEQGGVVGGVVGGIAGLGGSAVAERRFVNVTVCGNCPDTVTKIEPPQPNAVAKEAGQQATSEAGLKQFIADKKVVFVSDGFGQRGGPGGTYSDIIARLRERETGRGSFTTMEAVYAPGTQPLDFQYGDSAKLIQAGRPIRIEVHYTPNGKETTDQTKVAFTLAKGPIQRRFVMMAPEHLVDSRIPIPSGETNWETRGELTFNQDADLVWFMPHMHLRGKDMTFRLIFPDGREQDVLSAKFNFNWQLGYEVKNPIKVTKGTRMIVTAHHDNSATNPMNPVPGARAVWGEMTSQEMMLPWFGVLVDRAAQPDTIATYRPGDLDGITPQGRVNAPQE